MVGNSISKSEQSFQFTVSHPPSAEKEKALDVLKPEFSVERQLPPS
jgi:hypothetical protein